MPGRNLGTPKNGTSQNLAEARGDGLGRVADPAALRLRGDRGDVLHRHLAISIDEPARAPCGNYMENGNSYYREPLL